MTIDEKLNRMTLLIGCPIEPQLCSTYLNLAKEKILNKRFPFGTILQDVPHEYENLQIELAIVLYNQNGVEGQSSHSENGVVRNYKTENEILNEIVSYCGTFK